MKVTKRKVTVIAGLVVVALMVVGVFVLYGAFTASPPPSGTPQ